MEIVYSCHAQELHTLYIQQCNTNVSAYTLMKRRFIAKISFRPVVKKAAVHGKQCLDFLINSFGIMVFNE
jgi:hypothetical protein